MATLSSENVPAVSAEIERVFSLQRDHQWVTKASTAEQRKEKLNRLKAAVEAHGDEIVAAVRKDTRKPENEIRVTEYLNVIAWQRLLRPETVASSNLRT